MTNKFGPNGDQVEQFIGAARVLGFDSVEPVQAVLSSRAVQDAQDTVLAMQLPASQHSAIDSASRSLIRSLRGLFPQPSSTSARLDMASYMDLLNSAVFAFASRPVVGDETVGLVVEPFTSRLGFEWRSWGVSVNGDLGKSRG
jgi:hypothetical protein